MEEQSVYYHVTSWYIISIVSCRWIGNCWQSMYKMYYWWHPHVRAVNIYKANPETRCARMRVWVSARVWACANKAIRCGNNETRCHVISVTLDTLQAVRRALFLEDKALCDTLKLNAMLSTIAQPNNNNDVVLILKFCAWFWKTYLRKQNGKIFRVPVAEN